MNFLLKYGLGAVTIAALAAGAYLARKYLSAEEKARQDVPKEEPAAEPTTHDIYDGPTEERAEQAAPPADEMDGLIESLLDTVDELKTLDEIEEIPEDDGEIPLGCPVAELPRYEKPDAETLRSMLTPEQYAVTQQNGTEPPFKNAYYNAFEPGIYVDITTGEPLFSSTDKFESGCGWPAFARPLDSAAVLQKTDTSHGMNRTEVRSKQGDAHLGHVFADGPIEKGGLRYCINSAALRFVPMEQMEAEGYGDLLSKIQLNAKE